MRARVTSRCAAVVRLISASSSFPSFLASFTGIE
jgi:hypothetical protein